MDSAGSDRPQGRTALVGRELDRYGIEIAALSETCSAEIGEIKEVDAGYRSFRSGRKTPTPAFVGPVIINFHTGLNSLFDIKNIYAITS